MLMKALMVWCGLSARNEYFVVDVGIPFLCVNQLHNLTKEERVENIFLNR